MFVARNLTGGKMFVARDLTEEKTHEANDVWFDTSLDLDGHSN